MPESSEDRIAQHPDEVLLQMTARKSVEAYEVLYDRHAQVLYNLIVRIVRQTDVADELLQDVFWQIWQNATQYRGSGAAAAWMVRIARNRALDYLRREKGKLQAKEVESKDLRPAANVQPSMMAEARFNMRRRQVYEALQNIPDEQRICLKLAYFEGKSQREIAAQTKTALGTIKSRMRIGLEKLERLLRKTDYREESR
jgi:RNA polymerase sigma-70 factor, ECF subfamily